VCYVAHSGQSPQLRKLFTVAKELGLTQEERLELSCYLLRRDIVSWGELDDGQVLRLLDAFEGFRLVSALMLMRSGAEHLDHSVMAE